MRALLEAEGMPLMKFPVWGRAPTEFQLFPTKCRDNPNDSQQWQLSFCAKMEMDGEQEMGMLAVDREAFVAEQVSSDEGGKSTIRKRDR
jgi:hypothetical protein